MPIERAGQLVLFLASGRGDSLSGRVFDGGDNWPDMVQRAAEIERDELYVWSLRGLPPR